MCSLLRRLWCGQAARLRAATRSVFTTSCFQNSHCHVGFQAIACHLKSSFLALQRGVLMVQTSVLAIATNLTKLVNLSMRGIGERHGTFGQAQAAGPTGIRQLPPHALFRYPQPSAPHRPAAANFTLHKLIGQRKSARKPGLAARNFGPQQALCGFVLTPKTSRARGFRIGISVLYIYFYVQAVGVGFEPTVTRRPRRFSRPKGCLKIPR